MVMRDYRIVGEIANNHEYESTSQAVIRLIHAGEPALPAA
jgi:hypothetical protein